MNTTMTNQPQAEEWKISKRGRSCSVCQREFRSEEILYSGIAEIEGKFARRDVCVPCWGRKPELFSFWKTRMPKREVKRLEDINAMQEFFKRLLEKPTEDPARHKITYLTALLLARKRRVRLAGSKDGKLRIEKTWDGEAAEIVDPVIADTELEALKQQMEQLFVVELDANQPPA
ncbi:MAG: hypothetical protein JO332_08080 [Planctomycetaceae bacterium]|nr:hypothetical protein [Planctomycetaceae bacterium]